MPTRQRRECLKVVGQIAAMAAMPPVVLAQDKREQHVPATGPLRVHAKNSRYFSDASGRAILLVGSHMWNNLVDMGRDDPPEAFDFAAYLDFLERYGHNFIRLWTWDSTTWDTRANRGLGKDFVHHVAPLPWARVGSDKALDDKPKFDLNQFDPAYFDRLRKRVSEAGRRGIYVSVMLFEGWGLMHGNSGRAAPAGWAWRGHPFNAANNINGIDAGVEGDRNSGKPHSLGNRAVNTIQAAYIRKVVDTVNDLDNVLYEVINEGGDQKWDWWVAETVRGHEGSKSKQHPGSEYLVYLPTADPVGVDLTTASGQFQVEWFNPRTAATAPAATVKGGGRRTLKAPFDGDAVLYLKRSPE